HLQEPCNGRGFSRFRPRRTEREGGLSYQTNEREAADESPGGITDKFSGAAPARIDAPGSENVARRCARWNALLYRRPFPSKKQQRLAPINIPFAATEPT